MVADGMVRIESTSEEIDDGVPGVSIEIDVAPKRLLMPTLVIVGKVSVEGKAVIEGIEIVVAFKRLLMSTLVIVGKVNVVGRIVKDDGKIVRDDGKSVDVAGGNKVAVKLSITDTTADKLVTGEMPDMLGIEVTGIVFTIGFPSGPGSTARLANLTTVCVPLRGDPTGGLPKLCVNVHKPSE
jgi:hypothetical protein